jgi:excisionase family DNA binding protein
VRDHFETSNPHDAKAQIPEPLLNDAQAAKFLGGLHPKTVQRMARRGEIPAYRVAKYWRYRASELSAWLVLHSSGQIHPPAHRKEMQ